MCINQFWRQFNRHACTVQKVSASSVEIDPTDRVTRSPRPLGVASDLNELFVAFENILWLSYCRDQPIQLQSDLRLRLSDRALQSGR
jgi:hypothetical protein